MGVNLTELRLPHGIKVKNEIPLPDFTFPPLIEVAISVQFEPLSRLVVPEIGLLWQHYGSRFSHVEQRPPIEPRFEKLGVRVPLSQQPSFQLFDTPPLPRIWFLDQSKRELLQIQQNRFIRNWRKIEDGDNYPRYDSHVRPRFLEDFDDFREFLACNNIGKVVPNQCEVTYINHLKSGNIWTTHADIGKVFTFWNQDFGEDLRFENEDASFQIRRLIKDPEGEFLGRLHITLQSAFDENDDPLFVLTLIARGRPLSNETEGIINFIDLGREYIVRSFADITRPELHQLWGRKD